MNVMMMSVIMMGATIKYSQIAIRTAFGVCFLAFSGLATMVVPSNATAAIYKCTDGNGGVTYTQIPCAGEAQAESVLAHNSASDDSANCLIANNFANHIAVRMRAGESSGDVFDSYGGIDALPSTSVGIISYVYTHKHNTNTVPQRITALSAARCSGGSYGPVGCNDFPYQFIGELGGCDSALNGAVTKPLAAQPSADLQDGHAQAKGITTAENSTTQSADCQQDIQAQMNDLLGQMRAGKSADQQGQLQLRKNNLLDLKSDC